MKVKELLEKNIEYNGTVVQIHKAIEELKELEIELENRLRGEINFNEIAEEMADVIITLIQLMMIFKNTEDIEREAKRKLRRQYRRLLDVEVIKNA